MSSGWRLDYYCHCASLVNDNDTDYQGGTVHVQPPQVVMRQSQKNKKAFLKHRS